VFAKDGKITLVPDKNHPDFQVPKRLPELINSQFTYETRGGALARAINQVNIEVNIPQQYQEDPVEFISHILSLPTLDPQTDARVVINEKNGSIVISGDVEIGAVVVTHKNISIETGTDQSLAKFVPIDVDKNPATTAKLKALIQAWMPSKSRPTTRSRSSRPGTHRQTARHRKLSSSAQKREGSPYEHLLTSQCEQPASWGPAARPSAAQGGVAAAIPIEYGRQRSAPGKMADRNVLDTA
jgi:hypothetical protein